MYSVGLYRRDRDLGIRIELEIVEALHNTVVNCLEYAGLHPYYTHSLSARGSRFKCITLFAFRVVSMYIVVMDGRFVRKNPWTHAIIE